MNSPERNANLFFWSEDAQKLCASQISDFTDPVNFDVSFPMSTAAISLNVNQTAKESQVRMPKGNRSSIYGS